MVTVPLEVYNLLSCSSPISPYGIHIVGHSPLLLRCSAGIPSWHHAKPESRPPPHEPPSTIPLLSFCQ